MVTDAIIALGLNIFELFISLLPNSSSSIETSISSAVTKFQDIFSYVSWILPVSDILGVIGIMIVIEIAYWTVFLTRKGVQLALPLKV